MQNECKRMIIRLKKRVKEKDDKNEEKWLREDSVCVCVRVLGMIQRWKEEQAFRYRFSFHSYLLLCRTLKIESVHIFF